MHAIAGSETSAEATQQKESVSVGYLYDANGEVEVSVDKQMTQAVGRGAALKNDTTISTGEKSRAVLKFNDGQIIALQANTSFKILDYRYNTKEIEKSNLFFYLLKGGLRAITGLIGRTRPATFRLETRDATIGIRGTDFMVALDDQLYLQVTSGSINMGNAAGTAVLDTGQTAAVASANTLPILIKADELPRGIFSKLSEIPVPDPTPIETKQPSELDVIPAPAPASAPIVTKQPLWATSAKLPAKDIDDTVEAQAKAQAKKDTERKAYRFSCDSYGWVPGSPEYELCLQYAKDSGYIK